MASENLHPAPQADSFPPPPNASLDWNNLGFNSSTVAGHISSTYTVQTKSWSSPKFIRSPYIPIHGLAPGLNYGQSAYEGLKAFRTPAGTIQIFRPDQNAQRMMHSADFISIPQVPQEHFLKCVRACVALNAEFVPPHDSPASLYVRPLLFGSGMQLALTPPEEFTFVVFCMPVGIYHGVKPTKALVLETFDRAAPEGTGSAKIGGNYAPVLRHSRWAAEEGFGITLHLDSKTRSVIDEFSTSGFIGIRKEGGKTTLVLPDSKSAIKSVTATSCYELAKTFGWEVEHRVVRWDEVKEFNEVLAAGTAVTLLPIRSITRKSTGEVFVFVKDEVDQPGGCCQKLREHLQGIQRGIVEDTLDWCTGIEVRDGEGVVAE